MSLRYENPEPAEQPQLPPGEFLRQRKDAMRNRSFWALAIGCSVVIAFIAMGDFAEIFSNIIFILGIFFIGAGIWGIFQARRLVIDDFVTTPEAAAFLREAAGVKPFYAYIFIGCFLVVTLAQLSVGLKASADIAGLETPDVLIRHQFWRLLTSGVLHYGFLHLYFNSQAFYGFGNLIETLSNRAHLAIVFLIAVICGNGLSLVLMPASQSVGASGGVMGLIAYLAVYGYRRKSQLPPDFLRTVVTNIVFIAAFGVIGFQIVNNAAHLGGLIAGTVYGFIQVPRDINRNPRNVSAVTEAIGLIALGIIAFTSMLSILLILKIIQF
jgi:membrane associated rhomboid family serine protease